MTFSDKLHTFIVIMASINIKFFSLTQHTSNYLVCYNYFLKEINKNN